MGNVKRVLFSFVLFLFWSFQGIKCEDIKSNTSSSEVNENVIKKVQVAPISGEVKNLKKEETTPTESYVKVLKKTETKPTPNKKVEIISTEDKKVETQEHNIKETTNLKTEKPKNSPKEVFIENNSVNLNKNNTNEDDKVIDASKEKSKEVEQSIVKETIVKEETVENKNTNQDEQKKNISSSIDKINNTQNYNSENQYIDISDGKIYEEIDENNQPKFSNLYFLQILSISSSIIMQLILFPAIFTIFKNKTTGEVDGLPYVILFYSSFLWIIYGMLINNSAVVFSNLVGLVLGVAYSSVFHKNCKNMWLKQKLYSYYKICGLVSFLLYAILYFLTYEQYKQFVGFIASVSSIINFGAPLSYIRVIKKKKSSLIPIEMTVGNFVCSFLWLIYGITLKDAFLIIPNLCGFLLSLVQVILILLYSNKEPLNYTDNEFYYNEENNKFDHDHLSFNQYNLEGEKKLNEVSTNIHEPYFNFSYDETSPLNRNFNLNYSQKTNEPETYFNNKEIDNQNVVLNF